MSKKNHRQPLTCLIDRFEEYRAVLRFTFGKNNTQELVVAKRYLPQSIKEGDILYVEFFTDKVARSHKENLAKQVLEEILKGG